MLTVKRFYAITPFSDTEAASKNRDLVLEVCSVLAIITRMTGVANLAIDLQRVCRNFQGLP